MGEPDAAVAIVRTRLPEATILLMRRAEREGDPWSGHWSLPGGRCEACDADLLETALRELEEEGAIRLTREQVSATLLPAVARRRNGPFVLVAPFVFDVEEELPSVLDPREAVGTTWIPLRTLLDPARHSFQQAPGLPAEMLFPAIALPGAPLWGFTYRLLVDWLQIAPRECPEAGLEVAEMVLDYLTTLGLTVQAPWHWTTRQNGDESGPMYAAGVSGPIPVDAVIRHLSTPGAYVANANRLEIRPEYVRIHGLAFEEYLIEAVGGRPPVAADGFR